MKFRTLPLMGAASLAGALALAAPAWAETAAPAAPAADGLTVVRDAETGQLRAPTADEAAALTAGKAAATRGSAKAGLGFLPKRHASGAVGVRATDDMASYAVVSRQADGTLTQVCVESKSAAEQFIQSGVQPAQQQQALEK